LQAHYKTKTIRGEWVDLFIEHGIVFNEKYAL